MTKTILITRPRPQSESFARLLEARGFQTEIVPMIEIVPTENVSLPKDLTLYAGVIFTSLNAVRAFLEKTSERERGELRSLKTFAVGKKTHDALLQFGIRAAFNPKEHSAKGLCNLLEKVEVNKKVFLCVIGSESRDDVAAYIGRRGGVAEELTVYENRPTSLVNTDELAGRLRTAKIDMITFFSPSAVKNFFNRFADDVKFSPVSFAVIGETTRAALESVGVHAAVFPTESTAESLTEAIEKFYAP
jgi:uroporphyrinogen-III synthase